MGDLLGGYIDRESESPDWDLGGQFCRLGEQANGLTTVLGNQTSERRGGRGLFLRNTITRLAVLSYFPGRVR